MPPPLVQLVEDTTVALAHLRAGELEILLERAQALIKTSVASDVTGVAGPHKNLGALLDATAQSIRLLEALRLESLGADARTAPSQAGPWAR